MIRTSTTFSLSAQESGFTLIEMLVVVAIMVLITMVALPSVSSYFQISLNSATRDVGTNVKEASNAAMLTGRVYRLAYDLKENTFWVEAGPTELLLDTDESKEKDRRRSRLFSSKEAKEKKTDSQFSIDKIISRKKVSLPRGIIFKDVMSEQGDEPITVGTAYTHFFPHGLAEQTIIHLEDKSKHEASLVITPLMGKIDFYGRYVKPDEIFEK